MATTQERRVITAIPGPRSQELSRLKDRVLPTAVGTGYPVYIDHAVGSILVDVDGNQLIDLGSGIAVNNLGHGNPAVLAAARSQLADFTHTCFSVTPYEEYLLLAQRLNEITPGSHDKRTALFNSGTEAVENAVKIARRFTGRQAIVSSDLGYHGRTNLALALTAKALPYKDGFGPFAPEIYRVPSAYPYRWPTGPERCLEEAYEAFVMEIHQHIGEHNVAAVILEPIIGEGGFVVPPSGYLARISEWCALHGILLIADEVQTGFCRTGDWFACDGEGVVPDLMVMGKALGAGLPIAAVTGRLDVMDSVQVGGLGGTTAGNPVACAAALAGLEEMSRLNLAARAREVGAVVTSRLTALQEKFDLIGEVRGRGAMVAVELVVGGGDTTPHPMLAAAVAKHCQLQGVLVMVTGPHRNTLRLLPPLTISDTLLDDAMSVLEDALVTAA